MERALLRAYTGGSKVTCPRCGQALGGVNETACGRCHQPLKITICLAEADLTAWIALIVSLCLPAGPGIIILALFVWGQLPPIGPADISVTYVFVYCVLAVPLLLVALLGRRRFVRMDQATRWHLAVPAIFATGLFALLSLAPGLGW